MRKGVNADSYTGAGYELEWSLKSIKGWKFSQDSYLNVGAQKEHRQKGSA